jgi:hypothetical protein
MKKELFERMFHLEEQESEYSVEQGGVTIEFHGDELDGVSFIDPATVKKYARHAQLSDQPQEQISNQGRACTHALPLYKTLSLGK